MVDLRDLDPIEVIDVLARAATADRDVIPEAGAARGAANAGQCLQDPRDIEVATGIATDLFSAQTLHGQRCLGALTERARLNCDGLSLRYRRLQFNGQVDNIARRDHHVEQLLGLVADGAHGHRVGLRRDFLDRILALTVGIRAKRRTLQAYRCPRQQCLGCGIANGTGDSACGLGIGLR